MLHLNFLEQYFAKTANIYVKSFQFQLKLRATEWQL